MCHSSASGNLTFGVSGKIASMNKNKKLAFGTEPSRYLYRLRLARYQATAEAVADYVIGKAKDCSIQFRLLDVGVGRGRMIGYIRSQGVAELIDFCGIDIKPNDPGAVYDSHLWNLVQGDVDIGLPFESNKFDIVICEQVIEHLSNPEFALQEIGRVLRPDGLLVVGVPIHLPLLAFLCPYVLPVFDRLFGIRRTYEHVFTYWSFIRQLRRIESFSLCQVRGFRFVSGGPFAPLENSYWWYKLNRLLGKAIPWLCPEVQVVAKRMS